VTEPAKPRSAPPAKAAGAKASGSGFEFAERAEGAAAPKIDPSRRLAPSLDEAEAMMAAAAAEAAAPRAWVCPTCGVKAREPGTCCGKDRVPAR
jgi:hypothetical protein